MMVQMSNNEPQAELEDGGGCCGIAGMPPARFFKALGDPTRLRMLAHLAETREPRTVSEIAQQFPIDVSVVSRHLAILRDEGILLAEKRGKEVRYSVKYDALAALLRGFAQAIEACCPPGRCGG